MLSGYNWKQISIAKYIRSNVNDAILTKGAVVYWQRESGRRTLGWHVVKTSIPLQIKLEHAIPEARKYALLQLIYTQNSFVNEVNTGRKINAPFTKENKSCLQW